MFPCTFVPERYFFQQMFLVPKKLETIPLFPKHFACVPFFPQTPNKLILIHKYDKSKFQFENDQFWGPFEISNFINGSSTDL